MLVSSFNPILLGMFRDIGLSLISAEIQGSLPKNKVEIKFSCFIFQNIESQGGLALQRLTIIRVFRTKILQSSQPIPTCQQLRY